MEALVTVISANPTGETKTPPQYPSGTWPLDTPGGRYYAEWDDQAPVTREGQLIFFFQFLQAGGRWEEFLRECPLHYTGNRGSRASLDRMLDPSNPSLSVACLGKAAAALGRKVELRFVPA